MKRIHPAQRGFAAIAAIFLVVVLAALGGFMLTFSNTQHLTSAQDVQGSRAYWAARAGLEWGIGSATTSATCLAAEASAPATIENFSMSIKCVSSSFDDGGTINIFTLLSVASQGTVGSIGFVERSVSGVTTFGNGKTTLIYRRENY